MDFVRLFEAHQVERIRRAILAYRDKHDVGDVTLTKQLLNYLPKNVTYDSALKNVQRLRKGERLRGAAFLNACAQFLQVEMITPPEEELGLAMKHFVGNVSGYAGLLDDVAGDYVLRVVSEKDPGFYADFSQISKAIGAISIRSRIESSRSQDSFVVLSISPGEGMDYGVAHERFFFRRNSGVEAEKAGLLEAHRMDRKGVCLPVGRLDFLIMMRDCLFSHMYVLRRKTFGFGGTLILPSTFSFSVSNLVQEISPPQYDVALHRMPRK